MTRITYPETVTPIEICNYSDVIRGWLYYTNGYIQAAQIINYHQHNNLTPKQIYTAIRHMFHVDRFACVALAEAEYSWIHRTTVNNVVYEIEYERIVPTYRLPTPEFYFKPKHVSPGTENDFRCNGLFAPTKISVVNPDNSVTVLAEGRTRRSVANFNRCSVDFVLRRRVFGMKSANYLTDEFMGWRRKNKEHPKFMNEDQYHRLDGAAKIHYSDTRREFYVFGHKGNFQSCQEAVNPETTIQRLIELTTDPDEVTAYLAAHNKRCPIQHKVVYALTRQDDINTHK